MDSDLRSQRGGLRGFSINRLIPNILTLAALCSGLTGIRFALQGEMRLAVIAIISIWTPLLDATIALRWFSMPNLFWFAPVPLLVIASAFLMLKSLRKKREAMPFLMTLVLVFLGYSGLGISIWPNIIPPSISIWAASSPPQSQGFILVGALLIIPVILGYTVWSYYLFHGKIKPGEAYH